jgi:uncharacterized protein
MKKKAGTLVTRLLRLCLLALLSTLAWAGPAQDQYPDFKSHVTDVAGVMGAQAIAVERKLKAFEALTGHQVFVLTVATTGSRSIDEYAVDIFQRWKVGRKAMDDGVLLVVAVADRKVRMEVGYGLEGALTDVKCSRIIREFATPSFAESRYAEGVAAMVDAVLATLGGAPLAISPTTSPAASLAASDAPPQRRERESRSLLLRVIFSALFLAIVIGSAWFGGRILPVLLVPVLMLPASLWPELPVGLMSIAVVACWVYARYVLIANNVRRYHLPPGGRSLLTWVWMFFVEQGSTRPLRKGEKARFQMKVSFSSRKSSGNCSSGDSDSGGSGGRSGGAGASGGW